MKKIIITGANGVGKSHFAARLALARPEIPVISFDAIKLTTNWHQRPRAEIAAALLRKLEKDAWILEGGPSLLSQAITKADALVWLDPPRADQGMATGNAALETSRPDQTRTAPRQH